MCLTYLVQYTKSCPSARWMRKRMPVEIPDSRFRTTPPAHGHQAQAQARETPSTVFLLAIPQGCPLKSRLVTKGLLCPVSHAVNYTKFE